MSDDEDFHLDDDWSDDDSGLVERVKFVFHSPDGQVFVSNDKLPHEKKDKLSKLFYGRITVEPTSDAILFHVNLSSLEWVAIAVGENNRAKRMGRWND